MASYPLQNYRGNNDPLWIPNDGSITVSTINASTITTDNIGVFPSSNTGFSVGGTSNSLTVLEVALAGGSITNFQVLENTNGSTIMLAANGINSSNAGWFQNYITQDLAGNQTLEGSINILSTVAGTSGGVRLVGEDLTYLNVGDGVTAGRSNVALRTTFTDPNDAFIQQFVGGQFQSQIHFAGGVGNQSSISLVTGGGNSMAVKNNGIDLNPGSNLPVTLLDGYINVNNLALSNVSSINTTALPVTSIYPNIPGTTPFTVASNAANFAIVTFSNLVPGSFYRCGFSASFESLTAAVPNANTYLQLFGFGSGSPSDAENISNVNTLSFEQEPANTPGTLGAANAFYGCMFQPINTTWTVYATASSNMNIDIGMVCPRIFLEKLL